MLNDGDDNPDFIIAVSACCNSHNHNKSCKCWRLAGTLVLFDKSPCCAFCRQGIVVLVYAQLQITDAPGPDHVTRVTAAPASLLQQQLNYGARHELSYRS
jgi:hypothetical protein